MLGWLVVTEKLVAVPVVPQITPPEPVKPGSPLQAPEALYVLLSTKYASWAVAALRASAATRALKPRERYAENCGIEIAARMPMIATTTSNSINVKPLDRLRPAFCECMNPPLSGARWATPLHPCVHAPCRPKVQDSRGRRGGTFGACCPTSGDPPAQAPDSPHVSRRHPLRRAASIERLNTRFAPAAPGRSGRACGRASCGRGRAPAPPASGARRPPPSRAGCSAARPPRA